MFVGFPPIPTESTGRPAEGLKPANTPTAGGQKPTGSTPAAMQTASPPTTQVQKVSLKPNIQRQGNLTSYNVL